MPFRVGPELAPVAAALGLFALGLVAVLLLHRSWRRAAARREEVRLLMRLAAADERRLEMEASMEYMRNYSEFLAKTTEKVAARVPVHMAPERVAPAPAPAPAVTPVTPPPPQGLACALCFRPSRGRCARCKVVRYCSGNCQIDHWRLGHKDECHPPSANDDYTSQKFSSELRVEPEQFGLSGKSLEIGQPHVSKAENSHEGPDSEFTTSPVAFDGNDKPLHRPKVESTETKRTADYHTATSLPENVISSHGTGTTDAPTGAKLHVLQDVRLENSCPAVPSSHLRSASDAIDDYVKPSSAKLATDKNNFKTLVTNQSGEVVSEFRHTSMEHMKKTDEGFAIELNEKKTQSPLAERSPGAHAKTRNTTSAPTSESTSWSGNRGMEAKAIEKSDSFSNLKINNSKSMNGKPPEFFGASLPEKADNVSIRPIVSFDSAISVPNSSAIVDVKQFTLPELSRSYQLEMMLFPYDLFVKLYNSNKVGLQPCGLTNIGNSCYANAVLQCLTFTRPLTAYLLEGLHSRTCLQKESCFTCEYESLLMSTKKGRSPLSPIRLLSYLERTGTNFGQGKEEDAHEFLRYAIDAMQSVCLKEAGVKPGTLLAEETTLIQQTFGGYLRSKIKCSRCKGKSEQSERMMDLTLEIDGDIVNLEQALSRFTSTEILDGENKYECDRCKSYERAKKKLTIMEAPNVLTIALKRFQSGSLGKLDKAVIFPEFLDLAPYMSRSDDKSPIYRLYAVIIHIDVMNASFSGHYVSYVKDMQGKWYRVDDSQVKTVELDEVLSQGAYMLLYARCSPRAPNSVRKAMAHELMRIKKARSKEARGKLNSVFQRHGPSGASSRSHQYPRHRTDDSTSFPISNQPSESHQATNDSFSDSSSLFSYSDEGSWSTESTRESTATDELWGRSNGEFAGLNSPLSFREEYDAFADSPLSSRHSMEAIFSVRLPDLRNHELDEPEVDRFSDMKPKYSRGMWSASDRGPSFLGTDPSTQFRDVLDDTETTDTDLINPIETNFNVLLRRPSRDRTSQNFY